MSKSVPRTMNYPAENVNNAEIEKPWFGLSRNFTGHSFKEFYYEGSREIELYLERRWEAKGTVKIIFNHNIFNNLMIC